MRSKRKNWKLRDFENEILRLIEDSQGYGVHKLFCPDFEGGCPCASGYVKIEGSRYYISTHCWRVNNGRCGIGIKGPRGNKYRQKVLDILLKGLNEQDWYGEYEVIKYTE